MIPKKFLGLFCAAVLCGIFLAGLAISGCSAQAQSAKHTVAVTFDYDFTTHHACSSSQATKCIARFNVYDISGGKPYKLFSIPVPAGAKGAVKGIEGESEPLLFEAGKHIFAVTAQMTSGEESSPYACSVWVAVP